MVSYQYAALVMFLVVAAMALITGVMLVFLVRQRLGNLRWPIVLVFLLSMCVGVLAARGSHVRPQTEPPDIFTLLIVAMNVPSFAASVWRFWSARSAMGPRLYAFTRPGTIELTWSGRAIMLMAVFLFLLLQRPAMWVGWVGAMIGWSGAMIIGWMGYLIAESVGRVELRAGGVLRWGIFYPWAKLGKFEWMPGSPSFLRIQIPRKHSDIRIACPDDAEINAILTAHGLIRW
jgi:hypothetical protein